MLVRRIDTATQIACTFTLLACSTGFAATPKSYSEADAIWDHSKDKAEYRTYQAEFTQFSNHFHLDEKDGCYALSPGNVTILLLITHPDGDQYAVIEDVFTDVDNLKASCFKKTYLGIKTKIPPFLPFVLKMSMTGGVGA
jgi:hypothetical protein